MTEIQALERLKACLECGDCLTCDEHDKAIKVAINALQEKIKSEENISLTLDELKQTMNQYGLKCYNNGWIYTIIKLNKKGE